MYLCAFTLKSKKRMDIKYNYCFVHQYILQLMWNK